MGEWLPGEKRLEAEIDALVGRAGSVDAAEDERFRVDVRGDEMPLELKRRKDRLKGDPRGEGAFGGGSAGAGRCAGAPTGHQAEPEGRPPVQARIRGTGREGAEQLYGSPEPDHEDIIGGFSAVLQRAVGGG